MQVVVNLVDNAIKYTPVGSVIQISAYRKDHQVVVEVADNGPGIPAERQENLFKPFAEIKDLTQGDGLGLPICSLIAVKMNGSLTLDTSYTRGCRFVLELHV